MAEKKKNSNTRSGGRSSAAAREKKGGRAKAAEKAEPRDHRLRDEIIALLLLALGIFMIIAMQTDMAGAAGEAIGNALKGAFGFGALVMPYFIIVFSVCVLMNITAPFRIRTIVILTVLFLMIDIINAGRFVDGIDFSKISFGSTYSSGKALDGAGLFGTYTGGGIDKLLGITGLYIFAAVISLICILLLFNTPISRLIEKAGERKAMLKERKEEKEMAFIRSEQAREAEAAEFEAKRKAVEQAGRGAGPDYTPLSERVKDMGPYSGETRKQTRRSFFENFNFFNGSANDKNDRSGYLKKLPENKRNIISMVSSNDLFEQDKSDNGEASYGLDDERSSSVPEFRRNIEISSDGSAASEVPLIRGFGSNIDDVGKPRSSGIGFEDNVGRSKSELPDTSAESLKKDIEMSERKTSHRYRLPSTDLLETSPTVKKKHGLEAALDSKADLLEQTLRSFNVNAKVVNVISGPSVTRYEIQPEIGVKVSSIVRLADDIALNLRARSIRIEAPIPGKAAIGIEVENEERETVKIRDIISSANFRQHKSKLAFAVGRDIGGRSVVADLDKMPHMLIAGATGSGKSVCINTIILSILYKAKPDEVKLVLVDPKMVELGNYNGIPHLLIPVVTDASKAAAALNWAVSEMTDRYKKFASEGVRNISAYNKVMKDSGNKEDILPRIVVIIDELADLMMVASSQVEDSICRLAQLARAAGMHLIVATQRPSVDVVTGLIKANIPSRMAFMVSSQIDSRTIIDMPGAEKLVGNGDCLFKPQDLNKPIRVQCPFVSDKEVESVIDFVKSQVEDIEYSDEVMSNVENGIKAAADSDDDDVLLSDAIECVVLAGQASVSMLQRRFRIGYNRAARIVDLMEARGIVGPQDGSRPRQVNLTEEKLREMQEAGEI